MSRRVILGAASAAGAVLAPEEPASGIPLPPSAQPVPDGPREAAPPATTAVAIATPASGGAAAAVPSATRNGVPAMAPGPGSDAAHPSAAFGLSTPAFVAGAGMLLAGAALFFGIRYWRRLKP